MTEASVDGAKGHGSTPDPTPGFPTHECRGSRPFFAGMVLLAAGLGVGAAALGSLILAVLAIGYTGWSAYRLIAPGRLRVTEDGLVDDTFWHSPGLIPWRTITDVRPARWALIEIDLVDENAFVEKLGPLKQMALLKQQLYGFGPAIIVPWVLQGSRQSILETLQDGLDAYTHIALAEERGAERRMLPGDEDQRPGGPSG